MLQRKPLRNELHKEILARIGDRRLPPGQRINESRLSSSMGISRTPLREAMLGLEAQGFLGSHMGRGFLVPPLDVQEFVDIQFMLTDLKPLALSLSFPLPPGRIMELHNHLGRARLRAKEPGLGRVDAVIDMIHPYSRLMLGTCSNSLLAADINRLDVLARRYWHEAGVMGFDPVDYFKSHDELYELLRTDKREEAVHFWQGHIDRFSAEAARHLPNPPLDV
ncbi:MAG: GntR family transcriptional regulator [Candidatus Krumholzibacteria bacterium]|nr:GntR family transcriptional regulator [Candidatus Krumholzibacteria bacterium]